uniref:Secreted protein n=1 Tax=Panagrellus redivivus TaxID=6233 RepID=A0A7E4VPK2_PANRE
MYGLYRLISTIVLGFTVFLFFNTVTICCCESRFTLRPITTDSQIPRPQLADSLHGDDTIQLFHTLVADGILRMSCLARWRCNSKKKKPKMLSPTTSATAGGTIECNQFDGAKRRHRKRKKQRVRCAEKSM